LHVRNLDRRHRERGVPARPDRVGRLVLRVLAAVHDELQIEHVQFLHASQVQVVRCAIVRRRLVNAIGYKM
jgi:hypothetical protein